MHPSNIGLGTTITATDCGNHFASLDDGTVVFIPSGVAHAIKLQIGDQALLTYVENRPRNGKASCEWFCIHAVKCDEHLESLDTDKVLSVLERGDVWTPADVAKEAGTEINATRAFLEVHFAAGNGVKFARFDAAHSGPVEVYFTLFPERIDIAEFYD